MFSPAPSTTDLFPASTRVFLREKALLASHAVEEVIHLLAGEVASLLNSPDLALPICRSALERETAESTFIGQGLAVPHARLPKLDHAIIYLAHSAAGIPWPKQKAHTISLLIVPEHQPELHLQLLSRIVRACRKGLLYHPAAIGTSGATHLFPAG